MRRIARPLLLAIAVCSCAHAARGTAALPTSGRRAPPLTALVVRVLRERHPRALRAAATGHAQFLWLADDGRGRLAEAVLDRRRPAVIGIPAALLERHPDLPLDRWFEMKDAAFGYAGMGRFLPGEVTADTLFVFWTEPPVPFDSVAPPLGPYTFGEATAEQMTPDTVKRFARGVPPGKAVWYVHDDRNRPMQIGTWEGNSPDIVANARQLAARFPGGALSCSVGMSIRLPGGRLVRAIPIRYVPRPANAAER